MLDLVRNHPPRHFTLSGVWKQLNQSKFLCRRPPGQRVPASDRDPVYESHPNIRLVSSNYRSMVRKTLCFKLRLTFLLQASPFPVSLYPRGITSRSIEIDNAVESDDISHHLLSEAIARDSDARWEAVSIRIGPYLATGRCRLDWRRRERPEVKWASSFEWWYITSDALPEGAQALVKAPTSLSGARTSRTMAPVHGPRETAS